MMNIPGTSERSNETCEKFLDWMSTLPKDDNGYTCIDTEDPEHAKQMFDLFIGSTDQPNGDEWFNTDTVGHTIGENIAEDPVVAALMKQTIELPDNGGTLAVVTKVDETFVLRSKQDNFKPTTLQSGMIIVRGKKDETPYTPRSDRFDPNSENHKYRMTTEPTDREGCEGWVRVAPAHGSIGIRLPEGHTLKLRFKKIWKNNFDDPSDIGYEATVEPGKRAIIVCSKTDSRDFYPIDSNSANGYRLGHELAQATQADSGIVAGDTSATRTEVNKTVDRQ